MRKGIFIPLRDQEREALFDLADREWRRPVDQAVKLISDGLRREGALRIEPTPISPLGPGAAA